MSAENAEHFRGGGQDGQRRGPFRNACLWATRPAPAFLGAENGGQHGGGGVWGVGVDRGGRVPRAQLQRPAPRPRPSAGLRVQVLRRRTRGENREEEQTARIGPGGCGGGGEDEWKAPRPQVLTPTPTSSSILVPAEAWAWISRKMVGLGGGRGGDLEGESWDWWPPRGRREPLRWEKCNFKSL